jgi:hypothetical protein
VLRVMLASVTPDNTPHGYNLTFAMPMLLFIIIGGVLYLLLFSRPHRRVPARVGSGTNAAATATASVAATQESEPDTAAADETVAAEEAGAVEETPAGDAQEEAE